MDVKRAKELANDPEHIPGIYNYCDRWCKRCTMTRHCLTFAMEREYEKKSPAHNDIENEKFWEGMHERFRLVWDMIKQNCEEQGLNFAEIVAEAKNAPPRKRRISSDGRELLAMSMDYVRRVNSFFGEENQRFEDKRDELISIAKMILPGRNPEAEAKDLTDVNEVVRWYQYQINVKLHRSLADEEEPPAEDEDEDILEAGRYDSNGSAKVAMIGIDRSIEAWVRMRDHFPDDEGAILTTLSLLDRLRRKVEAKFPKARAFKRPGFDS